MKKILYILIFSAVTGVAVVAVVLHVGVFSKSKNTNAVSAPLETVSQAATKTEDAVQKDAAAVAPKKTSDAPIASIALAPAVPFTSQAPNGDWSDPLLQNGCEEAGIVMAMSWADGTSLDPQTALKGIKNISAYETKTFGYAVDADVHDVEKIVRGYYRYDNVSVKENITAEDIKNELAQNHVVLVPAFGRALGNPNYTAPGPITHMLAVIGWDQNKRQFITNDQGTRHGAGYRYAESVLMDAIWAYPSGAGHASVPSSSDMKKSMVVIWRNR